MHRWTLVLPVYSIGKIFAVWEKENSEKVQPQKVWDQEAAQGGPAGLGPPYVGLFGLKLKIYYENHILGAFLIL